MNKTIAVATIISLSSFYFFSIPSNAKDALTIISDSITYDNNGTTLTASGNVEVEYGEYKLFTPELVYNKQENLLTAKKPIELKNNDKLKVIAEAAEINDDFKQIIAKQASALIEKKFYVQSKKMKRFDNGNSIFYSSVGTTCEVCPSSPVPMWQIKSEKIIHARDKQQLHFRNARMEFLGVPIFYTPYLRVPEPGIKRATGLLTPKILTSNLLGVGVKQPFYVNVNNSSDITLSILKTTKTKFLLETDYRKYFNNGKIFISGAAKPSQNNSILDGYFQVIGDARILDASILRYDATAVSDSGFLGKFGYSDTDRLTSTIALTKQMNSGFSELSSTYFTSLRDNNQEEFSIAPNLYSRSFKYNKTLNMFLGTEVSLIGLTKRNLENDLRLNASFDAEKKWRLMNGLQLKSTTKLSSTAYKIHTDGRKETLFKYLNPTQGIELTFPLYRETNNQLDMIKPTFQLVYSPNLKMNDEILNTDSQQVKLDQSSLFSLNRFSGVDKQEYGLRLNSGVEYSMEKNGPLSYDLALGQVFRKNPSSQFSEGSGLSGLKSDILISGNFEYKSVFKVHGQQLYDQKFNLKQAETMLSYVKPTRSISSGLIFFEADPTKNRPNNLTELTFGLDSKLNKNLISHFNLRRNINQNENINASLKFSYENECAKINLSFKKRFTETNSLPADTSIELTFDLNGMGDKQNSLRKSNCLIYN